MWAADISHVNYLQFPNADSLGFQEKLSRREARHAGRKGFWGSPSFQTRGCLGVCPSRPDQAGSSCFLGDHSQVLQHSNRRGAFPQMPPDPS